MTYRVEKNKGQYHIVEKDTDLVIRVLKVEKEAREMCRSLNLGAGFGGFTPEFFTKSNSSKKKDRLQNKRSFT